MTSEEVKRCIEKIGKHDHYKLVNCVRCYVFSQDIAEDCVQDAYVAALVQCNQIEDASKLRAWITKVAIRNAYRCVEKYNKIMKCCLLIYPCQKELDVQLMTQFIIADAVSSVFHTLPAKTRKIVHMRYIDGLRFSEIADLLDMSTAAVRQVHQRAKEKLRQQEKYIRSLMTE